jgi:hypothetical protein
MPIQQDEQPRDMLKPWLVEDVGDCSDWMYGPGGPTKQQSLRSETSRYLSEIDATAPRGDPAREVEVAGLRLHVATGVFDPAKGRSTNTMIEALRLAPPSTAAKVLDVGTGSGVIAMVLWSWGCRALAATDIMAAARENARTNFEAHSMKVSVHGGDLLTQFEGDANYIVFNSPASHPARQNSAVGQTTVWDPDGSTHTRFVQQLRQIPGGRDMRAFFNYVRFSDYDPIAAIDFAGFDVSFLLVTQTALAETGVVMLSTAK